FRFFGFYINLIKIYHIFSRKLISSGIIHQGLKGFLFMVRHLPEKAGESCKLSVKVDLHQRREGRYKAQSFVSMAQIWDIKGGAVKVYQIFFARNKLCKGFQ